MSEKNLTVKQLRQLCKKQGVRGYSGKNKAWLLRNCSTTTTTTPASSSSSYTVKDLRKLCKQNGVQGYSRKNKAWLLNNCLKKSQPTGRRFPKPTKPMPRRPKRRGTRKLPPIPSSDKTTKVYNFIETTYYDDAHTRDVYDQLVNRHMSNVHSHKADLQNFFGKSFKDFDRKGQHEFTYDEMRQMAQHLFKRYGKQVYMIPLPHSVRQLGINEDYTVFTLTEKGIGTHGIYAVHYFIYDYIPNRYDETTDIVHYTTISQYMRQQPRYILSTGMIDEDFLEYRRSDEFARKVNKKLAQKIAGK